MITGKLSNGIGRFVGLTTSSLPTIGETIHIEEMGHAIVEEFYHNHYGNFVKVEWQETLLGRIRQELAFSVSCGSSNVVIEHGC